MSWASENKFLTGFGVVLIAGVGALGYMAYSAMGQYDDAAGGFESAVSELRRLEAGKPYPDNAKLEELLAQKQGLSEKLTTLQTDLRQLTLKVEPITKEKFQDTLKDTVAKIAAKAGDAKVTFPDGFYMDCAKYQGATPDEAAAPVLARQLRAMDLVVQIILNAGGIEVKDLKRDILAEERGGGRKPAPKPAAAKARPGQGSDRDKSGKKLIETTGFKITFAANDAKFRQVLNNIIAHKEQLFIVRRMELKNSAPEPPAKVAAAAFAPPAAAAAPGAADAPATPSAAPAPAAAPAPTDSPPSAAPAARQQGTLEKKFGTEKIEAMLEIDILDVAEPEPLDKPGNRKAN